MQAEFSPRWRFCLKCGEANSAGGPRDRSYTHPCTSGSSEVESNCFARGGSLERHEWISIPFKVATNSRQRDGSRMRHGSQTSSDARSEPLLRDDSECSDERNSCDCLTKAMDAGRCIQRRLGARLAAQCPSLVAAARAAGYSPHGE
eukprot:Polyplicarium_translucidae@DN3093_c0_g1_i6.p2